MAGDTPRPTVPLPRRRGRGAAPAAPAQSSEEIKAWICKACRDMAPQAIAHLEHCKRQGLPTDPEGKENKASYTVLYFAPEIADRYRGESEGVRAPPSTPVKGAAVKTTGLVDSEQQQSACLSASASQSTSDLSTATTTTTAGAIPSSLSTAGSTTLPHAGSSTRTSTEPSATSTPSAEENLPTYPEMVQAIMQTMLNTEYRKRELRSLDRSGVTLTADKKAAIRMLISGIAGGATELAEAGHARPEVGDGDEPEAKRRRT